MLSLSTRRRTANSRRYARANGRADAAVRLSNWRNGAKAQVARALRSLVGESTSARNRSCVTLLTISFAESDLPCPHAQNALWVWRGQLPRLLYAANQNENLRVELWIARLDYKIDFIVTM